MPFWKSRSTRQVESESFGAALRRSIAASIASVVVPTPPAGDRNEMIWLPSSGRLEVAFKDLMQALSTSFGSTGLRRKSETRIWSSQRTSASSKASATTITGARPKRAW